MGAMAEPEHSISFERSIHAGAGDVFAAWTLPELLNRWMTKRADSSPKVGGNYRYEVDGPEGSTIVHRGVFLALEPAALIRQSFEVESEEENPYENEFLELKLTPLSSGRTTILFTNGWDGPAMDEESAAAVREAWHAWFDQLEKFLALVALHAGPEPGEQDALARPTALKIVRTFEASPERLFDAWVKEDIAARWLFFSEGERTACVLGGTTGERWLISDRRDGVDYTATGTYLRVERPRRLEFTFAMPHFSPNSDRIAVDFAAAGALTLMSFVQSGPDIEEELRQVVPGAVGGSEAGWNAMFDMLAKAL